MFVFDGEPVFCLKKRDLSLVGDGKRSIGDFLEEMNNHVLGRGLSPIPVNEFHLDNSGNPVDPNKVLASGEDITLIGRRNMSGGLEAGELLPQCPEELAGVASRAADALGLRIAGVDLMEVASESSIRVIEVNASPGIHALEVLGRWDLIDSIWTRVIREALRKTA